MERDISTLDQDRPAGATERLSRRLGADLMPRVYSALVMLAGALAATIAGGWWFALLIIVAGLLMCWEWGRLVREGGDLALQATHGSVMIGVVVLATLGRPGLALALAIAGTLVFAFADMRRPLSALGVPYVALPALALVWLRRDADWGLAAVLFVFAVVWATDVAAYAAGRMIGGPKLAPTISPGKTWSGLMGGLAGGLLAAAIFVQFVAAPSLLRLSLLAVLLSLVSQAGDLAESYLKRRTGVKDASRLIPGHGGVLDRVDGLVVAAVVAAMMAAALGAQAPGRALIVGN
jgi:phosphatidate cytidylyltransferase